MAKAAHGQSGKFYETKFKTAQYYFTHILPETESLVRLVEAGKGGMMDFNDDEFWSVQRQ